jgi:hypothetical protein
LAWPLAAAGCGDKAKDEAPPPLAGAGTPQVTAQAATAAHYPKAPSMTPWNHPSRACEVLAGQGFVMGGWLRNPALPEGQDWYCASGPRPSRAGDAYHMTYSAVGDMSYGGSAKAFVLRLTGPRPGSNPNAAREEFAGVVMALADSGWAMSDMQPKDAAALKAAVKSGTPGSWPAGGFVRVEVTQAAKTSEALTVTFYDPRARPTKALGELQ